MPPDRVRDKKRDGLSLIEMESLFNNMSMVNITGMILPTH